MKILVDNYKEIVAGILIRLSNNQFSDDLHKFKAINILRSLLSHKVVTYLLSKLDILEIFCIDSKNAQYEG